ncbi:Nuclear pore complex protein NUP50B, partial [Bienertia sinuspersici]
MNHLSLTACLKRKSSLVTKVTEEQLTGDENQPSKKIAAGRELSRDNPGLDEEENSESSPSANYFGTLRSLVKSFCWDLIEAEAIEDKTGGEDVDTKDNANSDSQVNKVKPEEKPSKVTPESNADQVTEAPTEQELLSVNLNKLLLILLKSRLRPSQCTKTEEETTGEVQANCEKTDNDAMNENDKADASGEAFLNSFQQFSNSQNAFIGLAGTSISTSTCSFGSLEKEK